MRKLTLIFAGAAIPGIFSLVAHSANLSSDPSGLWKSFPAIYKLHSGIVSDQAEPTAKDRVLTVLVDGRAAKEIFESIGPDLPEKCSEADGDREREKKRHKLHL